MKKPLAMPSDWRDSGRQRVLDAIRLAGRVARIDIADVTGISAPTVSAVCGELLTAGLIEEVVPEEVSGHGRRGRPRVLLRICPDAHRIAGLKIGERAITVLLLDFAGKEIVSHEMPMAARQMSPDVLAENVRKAVAQACEKADLALDALSGVSIGLPGQIDAKRNFVHWSSSLDTRNVDFGSLLADRLPCPVFIDNDANLVAKAEHLFGAGRGRQNFLVVTVEHGVGLGIVIGGALFRGERGCGAEFGHTKVQLDGALCQCGQRGCLEAYVGDYALLREVHFEPSEVGPTSVLDLFAAAEAGHATARATLDRSRRMLAMGLANLVNVFDPELIVLTGTQMAFHDLYADSVLEEIRDFVIQVDAPLPEILVTRGDNMTWAKGAAAYGIEMVSTLALQELRL